MSRFISRLNGRIRNRSRLALESLKLRMPPRLSGYLDTFQLEMHDPWGGPFNGQARRQAVFVELCRRIPFAAVVETGTFRGATTGFLHTTAGAPVFSAEIMPRSYYFSRRRLRKYRAVTVVHADSRRFLSGLLQTHRQLVGETVFFYLDAHWQPELPLGEELVTIASNWQRPIIMIDDFEVPGTDYGFDDYGPQKRLCIDYLPAVIRREFRAYFPTAPTSDETGSRRGYVVLARREFDAQLAGLPGLKLGLGGD